MVRGSDRPESRLQRLIHNEAPSGKETTKANAREHSSQTRDKKKWRRLQRQQFPSMVFQGGEGGHSVRIRDVSEEYSGWQKNMFKK
ncbi:hypothetical protein ACFX16_034474 [Malus domestica]